MNIMLFIPFGGQELLVLVMLLSIFLFRQKNTGKSLSPFGFVFSASADKVQPIPLPFSLKELTLDKAVFYLVVLFLLYPLVDFTTIIYQRVFGFDNFELTRLAYKILNIGGDLLVIWVVLSFWYIKWRRVLIVLSILALLRTLYYTFQ